ncbi:MAG: ATP-binding protein [Mycobacterium sp.]
MSTLASTSAEIPEPSTVAHDYRFRSTAARVPRRRRARTARAPRPAPQLALRSADPAPVLGVAVAVFLVVTEFVLVNALEDESAGNVFGVIFLMGVLLVATGWGFTFGALTAFASALAYVHFHRLLTGETVAAAWTRNWVAITAFLVVALSASALAEYARSRAAEADLRRRQVEESHDELALVNERQEALRRVATLVARGVPSAEVFTAVARELSAALGAQASVWRYEPVHTATMLACWNAPRSGDSLEEERVEHTATSTRAEAPVIVDGRRWGFVMVGMSKTEPLPPDTESRIGDFADLVSTAVANAQTRAELTASRIRIVKAADDARRRIERDLHDGAQQRLVSLGLELRLLEASTPPELGPVKDGIARLLTDVVAISQDLQELSRGIHPAILSQGGLGPALKAMARRSAIPVVLTFDLDRRLPDAVEVAAYYVVAEALTNAAKHSHASVVEVCVDDDGSELRLSIRDDGIGGADPGNGSGLVGLTDRVEAIGGRMTVTSKPGEGTCIVIEAPLAAGI